MHHLSLFSFFLVYFLQLIVDDFKGVLCYNWLHGLLNLHLKAADIVGGLCDCSQSCTQQN